MQKNSTLSQKELEEILEDYVFGERKLEEIIESKIGANCNLNLGAIVHRISQIVRVFVLELQKSIWIVHKIKELKIYDHDSDQLFEKITLNLQNIIPHSAKPQFMHLHKNNTLNSIQIIWQTQYIFVHSDKKMEIYQSIIDFCEGHDLFAQARHLQTDPLEKNLPLESVDELFPTRDLELILKKFKQTNNNVLRTYQELKKLQINGVEYKTQRQFVSRLDNLLLIGVYIIHKLASHQSGKKWDTWQVFKKRGFGRVNFDPHLYTLLRVAVRNDARAEQVGVVGGLLRKKSFMRNIKVRDTSGPVGKEVQKLVNPFKIEELTSKAYFLQGDNARVYYDEN